MDLKELIYEIKDFPKAGIDFKDITPLIKNGEAYQYITHEIARFAKECKADVIASPESRGFIFGCPAATEVGIGFIPFRKPNKLPRRTMSVCYGLEYGNDVLQVHADDIKKGDRIVLVDDLLASGGTIEACVKLLEELGAIVVGICFVVELSDLAGRKRLKKYNIKSIVKY